MANGTTCLQALHAPPSARARRWLVALFGLLLLFNAIKAFNNVASGVTSDLRTYYTAAEDIRNGRTPYQHRSWLNDYIYPPFFCWSWVPLTLLPMPWAAAAWAILNGALWIAAARLALDASPLPGWLALAPSLLALKFILNNWGHGQVNLLLLVLVLAALACRRRGRQLACGALLGVATAVKVIPALFVCLHIWRREWRVALAAALTGLLAISAPALTAGPSPALGFVSDWQAMFGRHTTDLGIYNSAKNQSLFACMQRFLTPVDAVHYEELRGFRVNLAELAPGTVARLFLLVVALLAAAAAWRLRGPADWPLEYALLFLTLPLLSKTAMEHHWVMLLYVYTVLLGRWTALASTAEGAPRGLGLSLLGAAFLTNVYALLPRVWSSRIQALSPTTAATLLLWGTVWMLLGQQSAQNSAAGRASGTTQP